MTALPRVRARVPVFPSLALMALLLAGCATPSAPSLDGLLTPPKAIADAFAPLTVPPKFRQAVGSGDDDGALRLYEQHGALLEREAPAEVARLAAAVDAKWAPELEAARRGLDSALDANPPRLDACTSAMKQAEAALARYDGQPLMKPERRGPAAVSLRQALDDSRGRLHARLPELFGAYDHAAGPPFFEQLPLRLRDAEQKALVHQGQPSIERAIARSSAQMGAQLARMYGPLLEDAPRESLVQAYVRRVALEKFGRTEGLNPAQSLWLATAAMEAGGRPPRFVKLKTAGDPGAEVTVEGKRIDESVSPDQLPALARAAAADGAKVLVAIDPANTASVSELKNPRQFQRRRQTGTRSIPNPKYRDMQDRVRELEGELRDLEAQNASLQQQSQDLARQSGGRGSGAFAAMLGSFTGLTAVNSARSSLEEARSDLASTPRTIDEPVYTEEAVAGWTRETRWVAKPSVYVMSAGAPKAYTASIDLQDAASEHLSAPARPEPGAVAARRPVALTMEQISQALETGRELHARQLPSAVRADRAEFDRTAARLRAQAAEGSQDTVRQLQAFQGSQAVATATAAARRSPPAANAQAASGCHESLAYLADRLPAFRVPMLQEVRGAILATDIRDTIRKAKSQGYSAESAVAAALESAKSMEAQMAVAGNCAAEVDALGTSDEAFLDGIKRGALANLPSCDGIRNSCLCAGLAMRLGAVGARATAAAMQCHARRGQW